MTYRTFITSIKSHLIAIAIILVVGIIAMIAVRKLRTSRKHLVRRTTLVAMLLAIVTVVNLICVGPMSTMLDLVTDPVRSPRGPVMQLPSWHRNRRRRNCPVKG